MGSRQVKVLQMSHLMGRTTIPVIKIIEAQNMDHGTTIMEAILPKTEEILLATILDISPKGLAPIVRTTEH